MGQLRGLNVRTSKKRNVISVEEPQPWAFDFEAVQNRLARVVFLAAVFCVTLTINFALLLSFISANRSQVVAMLLPDDIPASQPTEIVLDPIPSEVATTDRLLESPAFLSIDQVQAGEVAARPISISPEEISENGTDYTPFRNEVEIETILNREPAKVERATTTNNRAATTANTPSKREASAKLAPSNLGQLLIPAFSVNKPIVTVPIVSNQWDISQLDSDVGLLEQTGRFPGDEAAMTFVGHSTTYWPIKGPFGDLFRMELGDEIVYRVGHTDYVYEITRFVFLKPSSVDYLFQEDGNKILLVTCSDYDLKAGEYNSRLMVEATLVAEKENPSSDDLILSQ